jgi:general secretion pathway protein I
MMRAMSLRSSRGFTLLELVVALVIFAFAFVALMSIATGAMRAARRSADYTQAALWAQTKLDQLGVGEKLQVGGDVGRFDARYEWQLRIDEAEALPTESSVDEVVPVKLFRVELLVNWREGSQERQAQFVTLRAVQPDANP